MSGLFSHLFGSNYLATALKFATWFALVMVNTGIFLAFVLMLYLPFTVASVAASKLACGAGQAILVLLTGPIFTSPFTTLY